MTGLLKEAIIQISILGRNTWVVNAIMHHDERVGENKTRSFIRLYLKQVSLTEAN